MAFRRSFRGSTSGIFGLVDFLSCPSTMLLSGFNFGGLLAIILAMSPLLNGGGALFEDPLAIGMGGGGGGGGGMLHGETGLGGVGSGVGGGGGKSWGMVSGSSMPTAWAFWFGWVGVEWWLGNGLFERLPFLFNMCCGIEPVTSNSLAINTKFARVEKSTSTWRAYVSSFINFVSCFSFSQISYLTGLVFLFFSMTNKK